MPPRIRQFQERDSAEIGELPVAIVTQKLLTGIRSPLQVRGDFQHGRPALVSDLIKTRVMHLIGPSHVLGKIHGNEKCGADKRDPRAMPPKARTRLGNPLKSCQIVQDEQRRNWQ